MIPPETHYAKSGSVRIAYQVLGSGDFDLVMIPGFISNLELVWENPQSPSARNLSRFAAFSRVIRLDKRGTGLSDRVEGVPSLEDRMDDVRAVMDAVGSDRAALYGNSDGGAMSMLFAATYPERTRALVLYGAYSHYPRSLTDRAPLSKQLIALGGRAKRYAFSRLQRLRRLTKSVCEDLVGLSDWPPARRQRSN
jgi:pimeloyl-ACP methyl ester carboxylesterase